MEFRKGTPLYAYEVLREGGEDVLYFNFIGASFVPSLAEDSRVMGMVVDSLIESPNVTRVVFVQQKNYNYDFKETSFLLEIAHLYVHFIRQEKILSREKLITNNEQFFSQRYNNLFSFLFLLKHDPISAYSELKKIIIEAKIFLEKVDRQ